MTSGSASKERPIILSAESVRATMEGRKTVTRRVIRNCPDPTRGHYMEGGGSWRDWSPATSDDGTWWFISGAAADVPIGRCPYGQPGDRLWVREGFRAVRINGAIGAGEFPDVQYREGYGVMGFAARGTERRERQEALAAAEARWEPGQTGNLWGRWRSPIFMPRWASRLALEVVSVRVERLHEITEEDAVREGVTEPVRIRVPTLAAMRTGGRQWMHQLSYREGFARGWDALNAKRGHPWSQNDYVWRIEYRPLSDTEEE